MKHLGEVLGKVLAEVKGLPTKALPASTPVLRPSTDKPMFLKFQTFDEPSLKDAFQAAVKFVKDVLNDPYSGRGYTLTLCGLSGTGKSMLTKCIFNELGLDGWKQLSKLPSKVHDGRILNREGMLKDWRRVSDAFKAGEWQLVEAMEAPLLLGIDDLGADYDPSLMAASKADRILRARAGKWTVVNCNLTLEQIAKKLDTRIASYLIRDDNVFKQLETKDFAMRKFQRQAVAV